VKIKLSQADVDKLVSVDRKFTKPTVYNAGAVDVDFQPSFNGNQFWQYELWVGVLNRCFSEKYRETYPTYKGVTVCDEWLSFANFLEWINKEVDYKGKPVGFHLDKDLIIRGNKIYCPEACSFVPKDVNTLLIDCTAARGEWPVGVHFKSALGRFVAQLSYNGKPKHLGCYDTPEDAFLAYKTAKEAQIKLVALQHKASLKPAVYESLMNWEITP